jgi:hypothetical protein
MCQMQEAFNDHMKKCFSAAWAVCLDESMVKWLNEFSLGWMAIGCKPSPFGNEYHTMAYAVLHVIFWIEIVEGKDRPPQLGPLLHVALKLMENLAVLCCEQRAETIKSSNRVVIRMDRQWVRRFSNIAGTTINTKDWAMRQFTFIDAMCECNAKQAYNYWVRRKQDKHLMMNIIQFRPACQNDTTREQCRMEKSAADKRL